MKKNSLKSENIFVSYISAFCILLSFDVQAEEYKFDPAFLGGESNKVADLSSFAQGLEILPGRYRVDIYLNKRFISNEEIDFEKKENDSGVLLSPCLTTKYVSSIGVNQVFLNESKTINVKDEKSNTCYSIEDNISGAEVTFDQQKLRLDISIPQAALTGKARGYIAPEYWDHGLPVALLNYNFNGSQYKYTGQNKSTTRSYFLSTNGGLNLGDWRLRNYSTWRYSDSSSSKWNSIKTYVQRDFSDIESRLTIGDTFTSLNVFDSTAVRGIQLESNDSMLPESRRGFAPEVHGIASSNAKVTIKQNGNVIYQTYVPPGAFLINDLYPTSSSGDLEVIVDEEGGKSQIFTVPFSSVANLVREGMWKYAVSAGEFRGGTTQSNPDFFQTSIYYGLPLGVTVYGGTQLSNDYQAYSVGLGRNMGQWGAITADVTHAKSELADGAKYSGDSLRLHYAKSLNEIGTTINFATYRYSTRGFYLIGDTAYKNMRGGET